MYIKNYNIIVLDRKRFDVFFDGPNPNELDFKGRHITKTVRDWGISKSADLTFNLGFFNFSTGAACSWVHNKRGYLAYGENSQFLDLDGVNICKGYSDGIVNNVVRMNDPLGGSSYRNGIGITTDDKVVIAQTKIRVTEKAFCDNVIKDMRSRGLVLKLFVLMDGGGSVSEYSNLSKLTCYPSEVRAVSTITCVNVINPPKITRNLRLGCKGEDVEYLQIILGGIECDGSFGLTTYNRLRKAQQALGLKADGICGPLTKKALKIPT